MQKILKPLLFQFKVTFTSCFNLALLLIHYNSKIESHWIPNRRFSFLVFIQKKKKNTFLYSSITVFYFALTFNFYVRNRSIMAFNF